MNKQEKQYAVNRIDSMAAEKCAAIKAKNTVKGVCFSGAQRLKAFRDGKFKIKSDAKEIGRYTDLCNVVEFTEEREDEVNESKVKAESQKVMDEAQRIKDQMMLGDATEALKMIERFAKL